MTEYIAKCSWCKKIVTLDKPSGMCPDCHTAIFTAEIIYPTYIQENIGEKKHEEQTL